MQKNNLHNSRIFHQIRGYAIRISPSKRNAGGIPSVHLRLDLVKVSRSPSITMTPSVGNRESKAKGRHNQWNLSSSRWRTNKAIVKNDFSFSSFFFWSLPRLLLITHKRMTLKTNNMSYNIQATLLRFDISTTPS